MWRVRLQGETVNRFISISIAASALVALAGCHNSSGASAKQTTAPPQPAPVSSAAPSAPAANPGTTNGKVAKPGQSFKIGQMAVLNYKFGTNQKGILGATVTKITRGKAADLTPLKLGAKAAGMIPYYIQVSVKNLGSTELSDDGVDVAGVLRDGSSAQGVAIFGEFAKCPNDMTPSGFTTGHSFTTCELALARSGTAVTGAAWTSEPYGSSSPVTWKP
jgi:hypothetical protein